VKLESSSRPNLPTHPSKLHLSRLLEDKAGVSASGYDMKGALQKYENKMFHLKNNFITTQTYSLFQISLR